MAIIPPSNQLTIKYTSQGKDVGTYSEFVLASDLITPYIGYYYEIGNKTYAGDKFNPRAPEIIKISNKLSKNNNVLLSDTTTEAYSKLSGMVIISTPIKTIPFTVNKQDIQNGYKIRHFAKRKDISNLIIREVEEESYKLLLKDPFHQVLRVQYGLFSTPGDYDYYEGLMPGLKSYLQNERMIILS